MINDLNSVAEIRNTTATIKEVIVFLRESPLRRKHVPNLPLLCETRWSQKYRSIKVFENNFVAIMEGLEKLSLEANLAARKNKFQLISCTAQSAFALCLCIISHNSAI